MKLSVVVVSYNVKDLLRQTIQSVYDTYKSNDLQVIVVENGSADGSGEMVQKEFPKVNYIESKVNLGFSKGNNLARGVIKGDLVLFLNADTKVSENTLETCIKKLTSDPRIGAVSCKVMLPNGKIDYSCHRGLPTPWNTFCYWTGLSKIFPKSKTFSGYKATYLNTNESHFIDCVSGTFIMVKKEVLEKVNWWDEDYFWNGDDIELCYQIKKVGYKIWYEASVDIMHFKGSSSGLWSTAKAKVSEETKIRSAKAAARAMRIFVEKHWKELGPWPVMMIVRLGIWLLEVYRLGKIKTGIKYA
jgi:hypothetical protein